MLLQNGSAVPCLDLPTSTRPGSKLRSGSGLWTIDVVAFLMDAFNRPLEARDTLLPPSKEELKNSRGLRGPLHQSSRRNKSRRSAETSTSAAPHIQAPKVKVHQLQANTSALRAPETAPAPSTSASHRKKTTNLPSSTA
ncbi:hypothetical protein V8E36_004612 [Tilletia maclaganii]